jgi:hypothetical protein
MPARSILSKHIPHLAVWSVSIALLIYFSSRLRADGRPCAQTTLRARSCNHGRTALRME